MHLALKTSQQRVCSVMLGCVTMVKTWGTHKILILLLLKFGYWCLRHCHWCLCSSDGFLLAHTIAEWSALLMQNIWMKCLHAFGINRHKCKADVSCLCQYSTSLKTDSLITWLILTHISLASHFWDIGKQCRPRSDAAERSVWSGSTLFAHMNFHQKHDKNKKSTPDTP